MWQERRRVSSATSWFLMGAWSRGGRDESSVSMVSEKTEKYQQTKINWNVLVISWSCWCESRCEGGTGTGQTGWSSVSLFWFGRIFFLNVEVATCIDFTTRCRSFLTHFSCVLAGWGVGLVEGGEWKLLWPMRGSSVMNISAADWCLNSDPELLLITAAVKHPGKTAQFHQTQSMSLRLPWHSCLRVFLFFFSLKIHLNSLRLQSTGRMER